MKRTAALQFAFSMFMFGTIGLFVRAIPLPSSVIALVRGVVGTLFLLGVSAALRQPVRWDRLRSRLVPLFLSGSFIGLNWILLFEAYRYTTVATATLCYYLAPILVVLASPFVLGERLTPRRIACVAAALGGMVLVSGVVQNGLPAPAELRGLLYGLGAALLYAGAVLLNMRLGGIPAMDRTIAQLGTAAVVLLPYTLLTENLPALSCPPAGLALLLLVGVLHTGIAYALYFGALNDIPALTAAVFSYIDPVVAILLSALLLREPMGPAEIVGAVLILGAAFMSQQ